MNTKLPSTKNLVLVAIIIVAAILRLWMLGEYPIHLTNDEAAIGYNAYSILKTGKDEHGEFLPIIFKSFGDWKPGLYIYMTVPSVAVFGLSEFSVRLPSALLGIVAVFLVYKLGERLFDDKVGLFSALALAILPWHIHFSRGAWEANLALTLVAAGILSFFKSSERGRNIIFSAIFFSLSLWAYQSAKLASLIVLLGLVLFYYKSLLSLNKRSLAIALVLGTLIAIPIALSLFNGKAGRVEIMSVFSYTRPSEYIQETVFDQEEVTKDSLTYVLFHSEALNLFRGILGRYLNYVSAKFLVFEGDWSNPRHTSVEVGYLLYVSVLVLPLGLYRLVRSKTTKETVFVLFLLAFSHIPAALTRDSAHGVRSLGMVLPLSLVLGNGFYLLYQFALRQKLLFKYVIAVVISGACFYSLALYVDAYYVQNKYLEPKGYFFGYKQVVYEVLRRESNYNEIVFSQSYDQPYIFFLFYGVAAGDGRFEPDAYQKVVSYEENIGGDVGLITKLNNIDFRPVDWYKDRGEEDVLLVGYETDFPQSDLTSNEFNVDYVRYPNGKPAFVLVSRNNDG